MRTTKNQPRPRRRATAGPALLLVALVAGACSLPGYTETTSGAPEGPEDSAQTGTPTTVASSDTTTNVDDPGGSDPIDLAKIPIGDGNVSSEAKVGYTYSCTMDFREGGARHIGGWYDEESGTWNYLEKVRVAGDVAWPGARYELSLEGNDRMLRTNGLPRQSTTGVFPILRSDPAYEYDTNPNAIAEQDLTYVLPATPQVVDQPSCTPLGPIGVMNDGVVLFNSLDDAGLDAVAHEVQDHCDGHPSGREIYHYHNVANCLLDEATGSSTLAGYALDGFGIYVERDAAGHLLTNDDLDECHGRTSEIDWDGELIEMYHYVATHEYPYTVGCFRGVPVVGPGSR